MQSQPPDQHSIEDPGGPYVLAAVLCRAVEDVPGSTLLTYRDITDMVAQRASLP
jgi:hypothetical protein